MTSTSTGDRCAVIGAGIAGVACAQAIAELGIGVDLFDRGHRIGGRIAAMTLRVDGPWHGRIIDLGASYLTVTHPDFQRVMDAWVTRGLARPWTDSFFVVDDVSAHPTRPGPMRYAAPGGLRSLVEDLAAQLPSHVTLQHPHSVERVEFDGIHARVDGQTYAAVALAMPDPQAHALLAGSDAANAPRAISTALTGVTWDPTLALVALYAERWWPAFSGMFVNDSSPIMWLADDGDRRGDDAPVLVAHSGPEIARAFYDDPAGAASTLIDATQEAMARAFSVHVSDIPEPTWHVVKRWGLAKPDAPRSAPFHWDTATRIGVAGDGWHVPQGDRSRIESAWLSGRALGEYIANA